MYFLSKSFVQTAKVTKADTIILIIIASVFQKQLGDFIMTSIDKRMSKNLNKYIISRFKIIFHTL